jgi:disulfide bond formation protein DsbB
MATAPTPPATATQPPAEQTPPPDLKVLWARLALFIAVVGVLGSLHLSLNTDPVATDGEKIIYIKACPLCYYQRAFIMAVVGILALGMFISEIPAGAQAVLSLAPASAGGAVAAFHSYLVWSEKLECPGGITGMAAPYESFIDYALLIAVLLADLFHRRQFIIQGLGAMLIGYVFFATGTREFEERNVPTPPTKAYPREQPEVCRVPYKAKT